MNNLGQSFGNPYHDHIIRDDNDFLNHWTYIETNPARWTQDEYYQEERERQP